MCSGLSVITCVLFVENGYTFELASIDRLRKGLIVNNLPDMIRSEMDEQGLTYRDVAAAAKRRGFTVGHSVIYGYAKGTVKSYKKEYVEAIAAGLGVSPGPLVDAARLPRTMEPFELPREADILTPEERDAVRGVVRTMIETRKQVMGNAEYPAPIGDAAGTAAKDGMDINPGPDS